MARSAPGELIVRFEAELICGRFVRRYQRFFADVELAGGEVIIAHCANPGSMKTCATEGGRVWLSESANPARKLRYTWELAEVDGALVGVNTARANPVMAEAVTVGAIAELVGWGDLRREVKYGERSRIDLLLTRGERRCYVEVKNVTLLVAPAVAGFPDAVTERGTRHLGELSAMVAAGHRAIQLYCVSRSDARRVRPADEIDPTYGRALRAAARAGVELLAYRLELDPGGLEVKERVPIDL